MISFILEKPRGTVMFWRESYCKYDCSQDCSLNSQKTPNHHPRFYGKFRYLKFSNIINGLICTLSKLGIRTKVVELVERKLLPVDFIAVNCCSTFISDILYKHFLLFLFYLQVWWSFDWSSIFLWKGQWEYWKGLSLYERWKGESCDSFCLIARRAHLISQM